MAPNVITPNAAITTYVKSPELDAEKPKMAKIAVKVTAKKRGEAS